MSDRVRDWLNRRWTVNLSILLTDLPLAARLAAAAELGFDSAELWWTLSGPVPPERELDELRRAFTDADVRLTGLNFDAGNMAAGDRGLVCRPARTHSGSGITSRSPSGSPIPSAAGR
jgi:hydroxypyruvate isomerase